MTPERLLQTAIVPALTALAARGIPDTRDARRFLLAIALQESGLNHRRQVVGGAEVGPASSFWQFEKGGGCKGVLAHPSVAQRMAGICTDFNVSADPASLWAAMQYQDIVAACAARLLVYTYPDKLPANVTAGWLQYAATWRPGKPRPSEWAGNWDRATAAVDALDEAGGRRA